MALGAGTLEARPTENVRRGQVEQVERQQPRAPAAVDDLRFREERTRQMDEELINRIQDRAEDEADAVDDTAFNPLKQWQSPNVFPQVAQYGDDKGDNDMFNEPMVLD
jgi:predicted kinase